MKCTAATYDASTGTISVTFTVDENGTKLVSVKTLEDNPTAKPNTIDAYSPEGGLIIKSENFRKDAVAVPGEADFSGQLDLNPWMALIFPLRFQAETEHQGLTLAVPPATVDFVVENGTWADGTTDIKSVIVPTEVVQLNGVWQAAGQLPQDQIPSGMKAAEGFNPESGTWTPALNTTEHGVVLTDPEAASLTYTYSYEPNVVVKNVPIYRVYNPNSGEHFYTEDENERDFLVKAGWDDENIGWTSPQASNYPVYRLYNPNSGDHHFTMNEKEKDILSTIGWTYEGVSWYSLPYGTGIKVYREYNPNAKLAGAHNFTTSAKENNFLISVGWLGEGVGWWAVE